MDTKSLARFGMTCREYNMLAASDEIWSSHFLQKWGPLKFSRVRRPRYKYNNSDMKDDTKEKEQFKNGKIESSNSSDGHEKDLEDGANRSRDQQCWESAIQVGFGLRTEGYWRRRYNKEELVDMSMRRGQTSVTEYHGHVGVITCLKLLSDKRVISGSDDGSMLLWTKCPKLQKSSELRPPPSLALAELALGKKRNDASELRKSNPTPLSLAAGSHKINFASRCPPRASNINTAALCKSRTLHGHGGPVWCLSYNEATEQVYSGGYDETVKVWDLSTGNCTGTLRGHTGWVSSLVLLPNTGHVSNPKLTSASWDNTLRVWNMDHDDLEGGFLVQTLEAGQESGALLCISASHSNTGAGVSVGCCNAQIQNWDLEAGVLTSSLLGHSKEVHAIQTSNNRLISGSGDGSVKLWDASSNECVSTMHEHGGSVMAVQYDEDFRVMSGSYDKTVKVWDIRNTSRSLVTIGGHHSAVFCLQFDDERLVTGSADYTMRVFDWVGLSPT